MPDATAEIYLLLTEEQKKNEELQILTSDLKIETGSMRMKIIELEGQKEKLEEKIILLQDRLSANYRYSYQHLESYSNGKLLDI